MPNDVSNFVASANTMIIDRKDILRLLLYSRKFKQGRALPLSGSQADELHSTLVASCCVDGEGASVQQEIE